MSVLLIGRWDGGTLTVTESHKVADGDQQAVNALLDRDDRAELWAREYLVDRHDDAVQRAYEEQIIPGSGEDLVDDVEGYDPTR
ncbi:hypothetical protein [Streptomyces sp. NPDC046976]|uniref:hypothetical protein n=1 Tax=Streptomyces sp. NPDC046976 TaxID=3155258 RepID=UPI0033C9D584